MVFYRKNPPTFYIFKIASLLVITRGVISGPGTQKMYDDIIDKRPLSFLDTF